MATIEINEDADKSALNLKVNWENAILSKI
jgi:hypothetical protein